MHQLLASLADRYWEASLAHHPTTASLIGDHRFDAQLEDASREAEDAFIDDLDDVASTVAEIDPSELQPAERISRAVLAFEARSQAEALRSRMAELAVDPMNGVHISLIQGIGQLRAGDRSQADSFVVKASKVGRLFDQMIERHRQGVAGGRTPPRILAEKVIGQIDAYLAAPADDDSFLHIPAPVSMSQSEVDAWRAELKRQVESVIRPAFERYRQVITDEVLPVSRPPEHSGIGWLPDGDEVYARAVARYTTTDLTPDEIHQLGLDDIAALADEYHSLGTVALGNSDVPAIYEQLRTDPALRFEDADQVRAAAEDALARATAAVPQWFGRIPKAPCVVEPIPDVGAGDSTIAYYLMPSEDGARPGIYFINLAEPTTRTRYEAEALAFHESVPGHHLQLSIAQELDGVPAFQRQSFGGTAYIEGWGLYTERLADEMGLYSGDLERLGMLSFDSWRACRLVVDTGMHAKGWSRQQAIDYMLANSPQAPNNVVNEVDRYIGWPGQALAYKIGQHRIMDLRGEAQRTLGDRFDIKAFHDVVLGSGPVPLDVLSEMVGEWVATSQ
jgi:uncharacterized protein (DUF885 family)